MNSLLIKSVSLLFLFLPAWPSLSISQEQTDNLTVQNISDRFYVLTGTLPSGLVNMGVNIGDDGILVINGLVRRMGAKVMEGIPLKDIASHEKVIHIANRISHRNNASVKRSILGGILADIYFTNAGKVDGITRVIGDEITIARKVK